MPPEESAPEKKADSVDPSIDSHALWRGQDLRRMVHELEM